jgi:mycofactocin precursor
MAEVTTTASKSDESRVETELLVEEDLLVEDVSIDGMCGVY